MMLSIVIGYSFSPLMKHYHIIFPTHYHAVNLLGKDTRSRGYQERLRAGWEWMQK